MNPSFDPFFPFLSHCLVRTSVYDYPFRPQNLGFPPLARVKMWRHCELETCGKRGCANFQKLPCFQTFKGIADAILRVLGLQMQFC